MENTEREWEQFMEYRRHPARYRRLMRRDYALWLGFGIIFLGALVGFLGRSCAGGA
jgi:hypothetical protein